MFHIIGVSHRAHTIQKAAIETTEQTEYRTCLESAIAKYHPALIGEELSEYALKYLGKIRGMPQMSLTKAIADAAGVEHRFCDPDDEARAKMGYVEGWSLAQRMIMQGSFSDQEAIIRGSAIEVAKHWPDREKFWLDQMMDVITKEVIFVCGDAHVERFQKLLSNNGVNSDAIGRHFGVTQHDDQRWSKSLLAPVLFGSASISITWFGISPLCERSRSTFGTIPKEPASSTGAGSRSFRSPFPSVFRTASVSRLRRSGFCIPQGPSAYALGYPVTRLRR